MDLLPRERIRPRHSLVRRPVQPGGRHRATRVMAAEDGCRAGTAPQRRRGKPIQSLNLDSSFGWRVGVLRWGCQRRGGGRRVRHTRVPTTFARKYTARDSAGRVVDLDAE